MRVNISIPDKMNAEIQKQKDFNVSYVCQEALENALKMRASIFEPKGHGKRLQELAKQREKSELECFEVGTEYGRKLALSKDLSYDDLATVSNTKIIPEEWDQIIDEMKNISEENNFKYVRFHSSVVIGIEQVLEHLEGK